MDTELEKKGLTREDLDARVQRAVDNYMGGLNCCQSVVEAFADLYGYSQEQAVLMGAGFGGGVAGLHMMCGTVSGLVMLLGMDCGTTDPSDGKKKAACFRTVREQIRKSGDINGSVICGELLGLDGPAPESSYVPTPRTAELCRRKPCAAKVECSARIFADYLAGK